MKQCSQCRQIYTDDDLNFCLSDGTPLVFAPDSSEETLIRPSPSVQQTLQPVQQGVNPLLAYTTIALLALVVIGGIVALLRQNNDNSSITPSKVETSTPLPSPNQSSLNETSKQTTGSQNTATVKKSQPQTPVVIQPTLDYATKNVRAGTADGKRLRVVVDLNRTSLNTGNSARFETLASGGASGEAKIFVYAQNENFLNVKYESKQARKLGTVFLSPSNQGLEIRVVPQNRLYLRNVFFIPRSSTNPNDRVVIDLCLEETCPSLRN